MYNIRNLLLRHCTAYCKVQHTSIFQCHTVTSELTEDHVPVNSPERDVRVSGQPVNSLPGKLVNTRINVIKFLAVYVSKSLSSVFLFFIAIACVLNLQYFVSHVAYCKLIVYASCRCRAIIYGLVLDKKIHSTYLNRVQKV
jgi:hypothetical protein